MASVSVSIDVPNIEVGVRFYSEAFGFARFGSPVSGVVLLHAENVNLSLLEKKPGSRPSRGSEETRRYERHWTPVHLDIHVTDLKAALAKALKAGARQEQLFENAEHGSAAFCSDPFGHGFCLLERKK
jgi:predicted enzyme related to lactoylglutathione lyase